MLDSCGHNKEIIVIGNCNINWDDKQIQTLNLCEALKMADWEEKLSSRNVVDTICNFFVNKLKEVMFSFASRAKMKKGSENHKKSQSKLFPT